MTTTTQQLSDVKQRWRVHVTAIHHQAGRFDDAWLCAFEAGRHMFSMPETFRAVPRLKDAFERGQVDVVQDAKDYSVLEPTVPAFELAIQARCELAMYRVMLPIDGARAERHLCAAQDLAGYAGATCFRGEIEASPLITSEPELRRAFGRGCFEEGMRQSAEAALEDHQE